MGCVDETSFERKRPGADTTWQRAISTDRACAGSLCEAEVELNSNRALFQYDKRVLRRPAARCNGHRTVTAPSQVDHRLIERDPLCAERNTLIKFEKLLFRRGPDFGAETHDCHLSRHLAGRRLAFWDSCNAICQFTTLRKPSYLNDSFGPSHWRSILNRGE